MKKVTLIATLCVTIFSGSTVAGTPKGKPFVAINDQIVEISGAVSTLQEQIDEVVDRVDTLESRVTANADALALLEDENAILQTLIDQNATDIESIQLLISDLEATNLSLAIEENTEAIAANESLIQTLQAALVAVNQNQVILSNTTTDLQSQINNNLQLISLLQQETVFLNQTIATKQGLMDGTCPDGSAVTEITPDGSFVCSQIISSGTGPEVRYVEVFEPVAAGQWGSLFAYCDAGFTAVSGSMNMGTSYGKFLLVQPQINAGTGLSWVQGLMINEGPFQTFVTVKAVCLKTS
jgi:hypothetical protein